jgi:hypothetical protein
LLSGNLGWSRREAQFLVEQALTPRLCDAAKIATKLGSIGAPHNATWDGLHAPGLGKSSIVGPIQGKQSIYITDYY